VKRRTKDEKPGKRGRPKKAAQHQDEPVPSERRASRRSNTFVYSLTNGDAKVIVCKVFFSSHSRYQRQICAADNGKIASGFLPVDDRGRHAKKTIDASDFDDVCAHIRSFTPIPSHYCRKETQRTYLPGELSVAEMYRQYKDSRVADGRSFVLDSTYGTFFSKLQHFFLAT
jgi:hypothetical protein